MENRFKFAKDFIADLQEEIDDDCTVSFSYGPQGFTMTVSFHEHPEVDEDELLRVDFEDSDFKDSKVYEESVVDQVREYVSENIYQN